MVAPVASPSSTTIAVRPATASGGRAPRNCALATLAVPRVPGARTCSRTSSRPAAWRSTSSFSTSAPPLAIAPIASSGCHGRPSLRTTSTSSGRPSARRDLVGDRNAAARQSEHDRVACTAVRDERPRERAAGVHAILEYARHMLCSDSLHPCCATRPRRRHSRKYLSAILACRPSVAPMRSAADTHTPEPADRQAVEPALAEKVAQLRGALRPGRRGDRDALRLDLPRRRPRAQAAQARAPGHDGLPARIEHAARRLRGRRPAQSPPCAGRVPAHPAAHAARRRAVGARRRRRNRGLAGGNAAPRPALVPGRGTRTRRRVASQMLERVADLLAAFYASAPPAISRPGELGPRLAAQAAANALRARGPGRAALRRLARLQSHRARAARTRAGLDGRPRGCVVEGHGDLRPEHILLSDPPAVIDCLEFDRDLRVLDRAEELCVLEIECARIGHAATGRWLLDACLARLADRRAGRAARLLPQPPRRTPREALRLARRRNPTAAHRRNGAPRAAQLPRHRARIAARAAG